MFNILKPLVWFDALTPKQLLIGESLRRFLERYGIELLLTARDYDAIKGLSEALRINVILFGGYGEDLYEKLFYEGERISRSAQILSEFRERVLGGVSYPNPVEARVLYGIGRDLIVLSDSPHARHPHRLSLPLASYLVFSECIPIESWKEHLHPGLSLEPYKGFDELSWFEELSEAFSKNFIENLDLEERNYIVLRPEEFKASYYEWGSKKDLWLKICEKILSRGFKAVILPRYKDQREFFERNLRDQISRGLIVIPEPRQAIGPALIRYSAAVLTGGGTMAREAALQGVPGITTFPLRMDVDRCVEKLNLPLRYISEPEEILRFIDLISRDPDAMRVDVREALKDMKSPLPRIHDILKRIRERMGL